MTGCEALAQGLPVVGFDTGGVRQWLRHEENGLLVRAGEVKAFTGALERLLRHREEAARLGENGRRDLLAITPEHFASRFAALLEEKKG